MAAIWTAAAPTAAAVSPVQSVRIKFSVQMPSHRAFRRVSLFHFPSFQPPSVLASVSCRWLVCPRLNGREKNKLRIKAMTELVEHKGAAELKLEQVSSVQVAPPRKVAVAARPPETENAGGHSQTFLNIQSEEELVLGIKKEIEAKRLPANAATTMEEVYRNYHNATYIAGDRVVLDPVCKPFSMGRNLLCVYSKKHIDDEPELTEMKKRSNTRTLKEMALLLRPSALVELVKEVD